MTLHPDLFDGDAYPEHPGYRDIDTSKAAAEAVKPKASWVQAKVLEALNIRPMTTFEIAAHHRLRYETIQPRTAELRAKGLVEDSGVRGESRDASKKAIVWRLAQR